MGNRSIDSEDLENLFVLNVIGGVFLDVGVKRLSTDVDYEGTAQLEGISFNNFRFTLHTHLEYNNDLFRFT